MAGLTASVQDRVEFQREEEWRKAGVTQADIAFSRKTGIDGRDVRVFREKSASGMLFIIRCPKVTARAHHGVFPPKIKVIGDKTGTSGLVVTNRGIFVSDYDLLSVWRRGGTGWQKVFISAANGASRGAYSAEASALIRDLNFALKGSKLQHGCQDDYQSADNPGLKADQELAVFQEGATQHLINRAAGQAFYEDLKLDWVYDGDGKYSGPVAG